MSSYIEGLNSYLNIKRLSYLLIKKRIGPLYYKYQKYYKTEEELKDFIEDGVYDLYKNNVASVAIQYGDKIRFTSVEFEEKVIKPEFKEDYLDFNEYTVASLVNALNCINYQIEIEYDKTFVNYIKQIACDWFANKITDHAEYNDLEIYPWGLNEFSFDKSDRLTIIM